MTDTGEALAFRPAGTEDRGFVLGLAPETGQEPNEAAAMLARDTVTMLERDSERVGFIAYRLTDGCGELTALAVTPACRGQGIGRAATEWAVEALRGAGARRVRTSTSNDNLPSLGLLQRCGFRLVAVHIGALVEHHGSEQPGWHGIPVRDELVLERTVSG